MLSFLRVVALTTAFALLLLAGVACTEKRDEVRQIAAEQLESAAKKLSSETPAPGATDKGESAPPSVPTDTESTPVSPVTKVGEIKSRDTATPSSPDPGKTTPSGTPSEARDASDCPPRTTTVLNPDSNDIYVCVYPLHTDGAVTERYLRDGNVNGEHQDPESFPGYLDGPELSVFHWDDAQSSDCPSGVSQCANISTSDGFRSWAGPTRPYWGGSEEQKEIATVYYRLRHMMRDYFDAHNRISTNIRDVDNEDELVVMLDRPDSVGCSGSCMRPWRDGDTTNQNYQVFRTVRPDDRNGGAPYQTRPKIFLSSGSSSAGGAKVQTHEFGHYYHRVFVEKYGLGGGFDRRGACEEKALDEGLGYWYSSDHADTYWIGRSRYWDATHPLKYSTVDDPCASGIDYDVHHLGDVITDAFWNVRELSGTDVEGWREVILGLVDTTPPGDFGDADPFGNGSIMRGFAQRAYDDAVSEGVFSGDAADEACQILVDIELRPAFLEQGAAGATNQFEDRFGHSLASGDFNGDGRDDIAVGTPWEDTSVANNAGRVAIFYDTGFGAACGDYEALTQESGDSTSEAGDHFGWALATGDFDGDGFDDLAIGVPSEDQSGEADSGFVHVYFGSSSGLKPVDREKFSQESGESTIEADDQFGFSLATGDFNGDGLDDLAVGSPFEDQSGENDSGFVHVFLGSSSGLLPADVRKLNQETGGSNIEAGDAFGWAMTAGDFNGDGRDDLAVGSPLENQSGAPDSGFVHVFQGSSSGLSSSNVTRLSQESGDSTVESGDQFGFSLAAGDFDGDGRDDLAIGSPLENQDGKNDSGFVHVFFGGSGGLNTGNVEKFDQEIGDSTSEQGDQFGAALAAGDFNGDGVDDLAIGIPFENQDGANDSGFVHVYSGSSSGLKPPSFSKFSQRGLGGENATGDKLGWAFAAGDFDGDGDDDLAISAPEKSIVATDAGVVYIRIN